MRFNCHSDSYFEKLYFKNAYLSNILRWKMRPPSTLVNRVQRVELLDNFLKGVNLIGKKSFIGSDLSELTYLHSEICPDKPWLAIVLAFGLPVGVAKSIFSSLESDFNVLTWEGRSILGTLPGAPLAESEFHIERHALDLVAVLEELGIEKCGLIGYCSGAGVALSAANNFRELFSSLVLVNGEYLLLDEEECLTQFGRDVDSLYPLAAKDEKTADFILKKLPMTGRDNLPEGFDEAYTKPHYFHRLAANYVAYRKNDFRSLARSIKQRTLLITGEKDEHCNADSTIAIKELIADSELFVDPDGDHHDVFRSGSKTLSRIKDYVREWL